MAHPTLAKLAASRARLLNVIAGLSETALDFQPADGWSIRQNLTHLVASEEDHCQVIEVIAQGQIDRLPASLDRDTHNAQRLDEVGPLTLAELLDALNAQRQRTEALFAQMDDTQLEATGPHPVLGDISVSGIFRILAIHEQMHTREIEAIRAQMGGA